MITTTQSRYRHAASWGAIAGGVVTALAVSVLISLLAAALGLGQVEALSANPLQGVGAAFGWTSALGLVLSLAAGGFVAGRLAGVTGFAHGFLTWAVTVLTALVLGAMALTGAARVATDAAGAVIAVAGEVAGAAGQALGDGAGALADVLDREVIGEIDFAAIERDIRAELGTVNVAPLVPDALEAELEGARADVEAAAADLRADPAGFETIAQDLLASLAARAESVAGEIDRDSVIDTLVLNTDLTLPEAEDAADRAIAAYDAAVVAVQDGIAEAEGAIADARQALADFEAEARRQADAAAAAASGAAWWGFLAALGGAIIAGLAGIAGVRTRERFAF